MKVVEGPLGSLHVELEVEDHRELANKVAPFVMAAKDDQREISTIRVNMPMTIFGIPVTYVNDDGTIYRGPVAPDG